MNDDRISRYLSDQAEAISLPPADSGEAVRRGNRRRARRRGGLVGAVAVVGVLATSVAVRDSNDQSVDLVPAASAISSTFDWSVVTPQRGLGFASSAVQLADGSVYSISTAPGSGGDADPTSVLYRSDDGTEWTPASLPTGLRTSALSGGGDTLYSVGTSPAGGLVVSTSADRARSWTDVDLPDDTAGLVARHPGQILLGPARIAARDGDHAVATIVAVTSTDPAAFGHPEIGYERHDWTWDETGLHVYERSVGDCQSPTTSVVHTADSAEGDTPDPGALLACREAAGSAAAGGAGPGRHVADFTYEELGITGELRDHVGGRTYAYVTEDGETFAPADLPELPGSASGLVSGVVSTDAGYRMVVTGGGTQGTIGEPSGTTTVLGSDDGRSWSVLGDLPGVPGELGVLGGRAAVSLWSFQDTSFVLQVEQADGTWTRLDLTSALGRAGGDHSSYVSAVAFGPLGLAAVLGTSAGDDDYREAIIHSADGTRLEVLDVGSLVDSGGMVSGIVVTADAIAARVTAPDDGDPSTPPTQEVLVGTPPG